MFMLFILCSIAVILEVVGDVYSASWAKTSDFKLLFLGIGIYFVGTIFWAVSLKYEQLSKAIIIFTALNVILGVLAGVFILNNESSFRLWIGVALALAAIIIIEI
jgi:multidrug transporter EmrE-like cation transporter